METLSHIIASFDIFQVIINAFPQIFNPIVHAFQGIFILLFNLVKNMVSAHPGLFSGVVIFLTGYFGAMGIKRFRKATISAPLVSQPRSL
jgi:hypothetical protein